MRKILVTLLILFSVPVVIAVANELDKRIYAPTGNLILDAKQGSHIKVKQPLRVDKIENLAGTASPPGMIPIGGMVIVMPTNQSGQPIPGAWQPPANCSSIVDGFMRAGYNGTCTVPSTCKDCVIPAGTKLPNINDQRYARGNPTSGGIGGANLQESNVSIADHPPHTHDVQTNVTVLSANLPAHSHGHTLQYERDHSHSGTFQSTDFVAGAHTHAADSLYAGIAPGVTGTGFEELLFAMEAHTSISFDFNRILGASVVKDCPSCDFWVYPNISNYTLPYTPEPNTGVKIKGNTGPVVEPLIRPNTEVELSYDGPQIQVDGLIGGELCSADSGACPGQVSLANNLVVSQEKTLTHAGLITNPKVNNEPKYINVVWVIRVK